MKRKVLFGITSVLLICLATQWLQASDDTPRDAKAIPEGQTPQSGDIGLYDASNNSPDTLNTSGTNIEVTDGSGWPENLADIGNIQLTGKSGSTAIFSGRTVGWGCTYDVSGIYTGEGGTGPDRWDSQFKAITKPRILLEVNGEGDGDDFIQMVANGANLNVEAKDVPIGITSIAVTLSNTPNPGTVSMSSTVTLSSANGFKNSVSLQGTAAGDISFSVSGCTPTPSGTSFNTSDTADATVVQVALDSVTFLDNSTNLFAVKKDDNSAYSTPHWQASNDQQSPICYKRNTKMKVTVKFAAPGLNNTSVTIKGSGCGFTFGGANGVSGTVSDDVLEITSLECDQNLPETIAIYQPLIVDWQFKIGTASFLSSGKSENLAYVVLDQPSVANLYHTVVHLSCKNAAGKSVASEVLSSVWSEFADRRVYTVNGKLLKYWSDWYNDNSRDTLEELFEAQSGNCKAWAQLLAYCLKAQKLVFESPYTCNIVSIRTTTRPDEQRIVMLIKNWAFSGAGSNGQWYNFSRKGTQSREYYLYANNKYNWLKTTQPPTPQVTDQTGSGGQGNANPLADFIEHSVCEIDNKWYDPSYGRSFTGDTSDTRLANWANFSIAGYYVYTTEPNYYIYYIEKPGVGLPLYKVIGPY